MNQAEIEAEIQQLKARISQIEQSEESRRQRWRPVNRHISILAVFLSILAVGFGGADFFWDMQKTAPSAHLYLQIMAYQSIFIACTLILMRQAFSVFVRQP